MDQRLLSVAALSYAGIVSLYLIEPWVNIPPSIMFLPMLLLACSGFAMAILGLVRKGLPRPYRTGALMISSFFFGAIGLFDWVLAYAYSYHTGEVCDFSKQFPPDPNAQWACPQLLGTQYQVWILEISLVIPALLFLVPPFLALLQRRNPRRVSEETKPQAALSTC